MCLDCEGSSPSQMIAVWLPRLCEMPVDAVIGDVEHAVLEPFDRDVAGRERDVLDLGRGLHPVDALGLLGPEAVGVRDRAGVHFLVLGLVDPGALGPIRRHVVDLLGHVSLPHTASRALATGKPTSIVEPIMRRANRARQGAQAGPSASGRPCGGSSRAGATVADLKQADARLSGLYPNRRNRPAQGAHAPQRYLETVYH